MYHKDYIMRMMEMLSEMIALLLGLIKKGDFKVAAKHLEKAYLDFLKKDAAFFHAIPLEELTNKLLSEHHYTNDHLKVLSELFYAEGELQIADNKPQAALIHFEKAMRLFEFTEQENATFSLANQRRHQALAERIESIKKLPTR